MKSYDSNKPLLSIHIPKCGGTSLKVAMKAWFGNGLHLHYYDQKKKVLPKVVKTRPWHGLGHRANLCIHGHFNGNKGYGIDQYYPDIDQAITFVRDPLAVALSLFSYNHRLIAEGKNYADGKKFTLTQDIDEFLEGVNPFFSYFLPDSLTGAFDEQKFDAYFVHIGVMEHYQTSMNILADKLEKPRIQIEHLNESQRKVAPSAEAARRFKEKCAFEYQLYDKALRLNGLSPL